MKDPRSYSGIEEGQYRQSTDRTSEEFGVDRKESDREDGVGGVLENPIVMTKEWRLKKIVEGATYLVVNDADIKNFGYQTLYWKEVLGCQEEFEASDKMVETRTIKWGIPTIWTCNSMRDPRRDREVKEYLEDNAVVVEIDVPLF